MTLPSKLVLLILLALLWLTLKLINTRLQQKYTDIRYRNYQEEHPTMQIYAVQLGNGVSYSSYLDQKHTHHYLDYSANQYQAWKPQTSKMGQWIQIHSPLPRQWVSLIVQGRGDYDEWVTSFKVLSTMDGIYWQNVENGTVFPANTNRNTKIRINFKEPVSARTLRIFPQSWHGQIAMRFEAIYLDGL